MTVPNEVFRNDYDGDGTTATYVYSYKVFTETQLKVVISSTALVAPDVTLVFGADYTVAGAGQSGGSITIINEAYLVDGKLPTGKRISIIRNLEMTQERDLRSQGKFFPTQYEDALDKLTMLLQQMQDAINRSLKAAASEPTDASTLVFPSVADRANMYLGFNSDGDPIAVGGAGVVGSWQALIDAANYVAARTLLGFAGTGGKVQTANIASEGLAAAALAADSVIEAKILDASVTSKKLKATVVGIGGGGAHTVSAGVGVILADGAGGLTLNLQPAAGMPGHVYEIKKTDASAGTVTVVPDGTETIDGAANCIVRVQYETVRLVSDGSNWLRLDAAPALRLVSTLAPVAAASVAFAGLVPGQKYRVLYNLTWNTAPGYLGARFNADSGNNYEVSGVAASAGNVAARYASPATTVPVNDFVTPTGDTEQVIGSFDFQAQPGDLHKAVVMAQSNGVAGGVNLAYSGGGRYEGAADITSLGLIASAGTFTGQIQLLVVG